VPSNDRKIDTRVKIYLGGLLIKAGLDDLDPATLYGAQLALRRTLDTPDKQEEYMSRWTRSGAEGGVPSHPKGVRQMLTREN
jgi:hypothetical protein